MASPRFKSHLFSAVGSHDIFDLPTCWSNQSTRGRLFIWATSQPAYSLFRLSLQNALLKNGVCTLISNVIFASCLSASIVFSVITDLYRSSLRCFTCTWWWYFLHTGPPLCNPPSLCWCKYSSIYETRVLSPSGHQPRTSRSHKLLFVSKW